MLFRSASMGALGAKKPQVDLRDYRLVSKPQVFADEFRLDPPQEIKDQGDVGSCVANMASYVKEKLYFMKASAYRRFSVGYIYGNKSDSASSGMYLREAFQILNSLGDVYNTDFDYDLEVPEIESKLTKAGAEKMNGLAADHKVPAYFRVDGESEIKAALQKYGYIGIGVPWYYDNSFGEYNDGQKSQTIVQKGSSYAGNHALTIYGWNKKGWLFANSWGRSWGDSGCSILPYDYPLDEAWCAAVNPDEDIMVPAKNSFYSLLLKILNYLINWLIGKSGALFGTV